MVHIDAERIRYEIARRALTQTEFARQAHISPSAFSRFMKGGRVTVRTHQRLTGALSLLPVKDAHQLVKQER